MTRQTIIVTAGSFASSNVLGGHYRSAAAVARLLSQDYNVLLVNIGTRPSPVMQTPEQETIFIKGHTAAPAGARRQLRDLMRRHDVVCVLAFDQKVGELFRPLCRRLGTGFVLVKPGGGQPRLYYPQARHQIVFMEADKTWIEAKADNAGVFVRKAAGRIFPPEQDEEAQDALRVQIDLKTSDINILRIGRISGHYAATSRAALALSAFLRDNGLPARTVMIGSVESADELAALEAMKGPGDVILTQPCFTDQASRFLSLFEFNIGTGRGLMEACYLGRVMFCATQDPAHSLPLPLTDANFEQFFQDNFSPRITPDVSPEANEKRLLTLFRSARMRTELGGSARSWFTEHFSAHTARSTYIEVIDAAAAAPERFTPEHLKSELHLRGSVLMDYLREWLERRSLSRGATA